MSIGNAPLLVDSEQEKAHNRPAKPGQGFGTMTELNVISTPQLARQIGVPPERIRGWLHKGILVATGSFDRKPFFDAEAIKKAQALAEMAWRPQQRYTRIAKGATAGYIVKKDAAARLDVRPETLMRWVVDGTVHAYKENGHETVLFAEAEIMALVAQRTGKRAA